MTKLLTGIPFDSSLIDYQEGAVVSKTLSDKPSGSLTVFAFDSEQGLTEHTSPYDAFVSVLDGEVLITISGVSNKLGKGQMILMPANQPHALKALTKFKMLLVMIR